MNLIARHRLLLVFPIVAMSVGAVAEERQNSAIHASLITTTRHFRAGEPILAHFLVTNVSDEPQPLLVPGTSPEIADKAMGLPLSHVFSGEAYGGLNIRNAENRTWNIAQGYKPPASAPFITLAPHSSIGATIDIVEFYPALRTPGRYWIRWSPYAGSVTSNTLFVVVDSLKQAVIVTDVGEMTMAFQYAAAPNHVDNFISLAKEKFYNNLSVHRIAPGYFLQGGCPNGDGTGIRPDGVKLDAEFSDKLQIRGSVSMALLDDDPDSGSCQFFITNTRVPEWDGKYSVFGQLIGLDSFETLDALMATQTDENGSPLQRIYIRSIRIVDVPYDVDLTDPDLVAPRPGSTGAHGIIQREPTQPTTGRR